MNAQPAGTGERLRNVRKRRGLTQRDLAAATGLSLSLIKKLEQGTYGQLRLETARKLAKALSVTTTALITEPDAPVPEPHSARQWEPVRLALEGTAGDEPQEAPTAEGIRRAFGDALPLLLASRFDALAVILPGLLRDAGTLVTLSADGAQQDARTLRAERAYDDSRQERAGSLRQAHDPGLDGRRPRQPPR